MNQQKNHQMGPLSNKVYITKRMEYSVLLYTSLYIIVVSVIFGWFYYKKMDAVNYDSYDMLNDALQENGRDNLDDIYQKSDLLFSVNDVQCPYRNYSLIMNSGVLFSEELDVIFGIRRIRRNETVKYYTCEVSNFNDPLKVTAFFDEEPRNYSQVFQFIPEYSTFDFESGNTIRKYISDVHITFYSFLNGNEVVDGFSNDFIVDYGDQPVTRFNVYIHCANEHIPYDYPSLSQVAVMPVSFILVLLGGLTTLFFLWHCWSYKYVLIKKAIIESGIHFER